MTAMVVAAVLILLLATWWLERSDPEESVDDRSLAAPR